jgi:hypothetical protein
MPKLRKPKPIIDEETIATPPELENYSEPDIVAQQEDINGDSSPLRQEIESTYPSSLSLPSLPLVMPSTVKLEVLRVVPLLIDAIKFFESKKPLTAIRREIIRKRIESANILINTVKSMDA